jgi:long-chain fatty acid transport protein
MKKIALVSLAASTVLMAGGYKIPENSINATALSAAYVANAHGAAATYYNPANMVFDSDGNKIEAALTNIMLGEVKFKGEAPTAGSGVPDSSGSTSESEFFLVPTLHYVSPMVGNFRFGASIVVPAGLSKRWEDQPAKGYANEFTLETIEFNPTVAYKITDSLAIAGGVRAVYTSGVVKSASTASRDMDGDSIDFGYNLAISYKPIKPLSLAVTYRSNIDLTVDGTAKLYFPDNGDYTGPKIYDGDAKVTVPIPAALNIAAAYTFNEGNEYSTTVELVYERTYWSSYETLDFDYAGSIGPLTPGYDDPIAKDWEDTNTFRVGVTQKIKAFDAMVGFAYDETPVPEKTLNFELPDSDALIFSAGMMYNMTDSWSIGGAVLMDVKKDRTIDKNVNENKIDGEFSDMGAVMVTLGAEFRF